MSSQTGNGIFGEKGCCCVLIRILGCDWGYGCGVREVWDAEGVRKIEDEGPCRGIELHRRIEYWDYWKEASVVATREIEMFVLIITSRHLLYLTLSDPAL